MKVVFSASKEEPSLHLVDRKLISARFARLVSLAVARVGDNEEMPAAVRKFMRDTESAIKDVLEHHSETIDEPPVDATLTSINDEVQKRTNGADNAQVAAASAVLQDGAVQFSCTDCSAHENRVCRGGFSDWKLFVDGEKRPGGLCVDFVRELTLHLTEVAEEMFDEYCAGDLRDPPDKIVVHLDSLGENHDGTMPLDGSYNPDEGELVVLWPTNPDKPCTIDEAILMLPYLLFHEVFVHGGQGRALENSIGDVPFSCSFTEGAVDAAARDYLVAKVLPELPSKSFQRLRMQAQARCVEYGQKRSKLSRGVPGSSDNRRKNEKISNARAYGTFMVWERIKNFELHGNKHATWKFELLTALNLHMNLEQRDKFMECADFWEGLPSDVKDDVVNIFDTFLEDRHVNDFLDRLDKLGEP